MSESFGPLGPKVDRAPSLIKESMYNTIVHLCTIVRLVRLEYNIIIYDSFNG